MHLFKNLATSSLGSIVLGSAIFSVSPIYAQTIANLTNEPINCNKHQIFTEQTCAGDGTESEEQKLYDMVNAYRKQNNLPAIPFSPALSLVANRHVIDLDTNIGSLSHDWSDCNKGWSCMWEAPQRLGTAYPGNGYENAYAAGGGKVDAPSVLKSWQSSSAHNAVLLNQGIWQDNDWKALGIGFYKGYAVLWVGEKIDPTSTNELQH